MKVFIGGSRSLRTLPVGMQVALASVIGAGDDILVGDGPGIERAVRRYLAEVKYRHVTVCTCRRSARANEGAWDVRSFFDEANSRSTRLGGYRFEAIKSEANTCYNG